jgi:hypothetical protein
MLINLRGLINKIKHTIEEKKKAHLIQNEVNYLLRWSKRGIR